VTNRYLGYALAVIFTANFLSYLDRQLVSALGTKIIEAYQLSDTEFGWVGSAFTIGYMVFAPVVSALIAKVRRTWVFAACVFVWSIATIASGYAPNKWVLYATRFFIGVGEAGCLVIGPTLLSDYFSKEVRGKVLSVFFLALPLGGTAGYVVGGLLAEAFGWQRAFLIAGLPGFLIGALILLLVDPAPTGSHEGGHHGGGLKAYKALLGNRTLVLIILAQAFAVTFLQPLLHFGVPFFEKERAMTNKQATLTLGIIALVAGGLGNMLSGVIGDRLARRGVKGPYALLASVAFGLGFPCLLAGFLADSKAVYLGGLGLGAFFYFLCMPAVNTAIANATHPSERASAYALAVFILHLLGDTGANPAFGAVSDALDSKQRAFLIFSVFLLPASIACLFASRTSSRDESRAAGEAPAAPGKV
jgi:MFS family permease